MLVGRLAGGWLPGRGAACRASSPLQQQQPGRGGGWEGAGEERHKGVCQNGGVMTAAAAAAAGGKEGSTERHRWHPRGMYNLQA
jgi:hypothetical protein